MSGDWLESSDDDWLTEPEQRYVGVIEAAEKERAECAAREVEDVRANLPAVIAPVKPDIEIPVDVKKQSELLMDCWNSLDEKQKLFLSLLRQNHFNVRKTVRALENTSVRLSRTTVRQWPELSDSYAFVLKVMTSTAVGDVVKKERLLLRADEIAEEALVPTPILHKGLPTGFYENHKDTALRANEQLMKATGLLREGQQSTRVTVRLVNLAGPEAEAIEGEVEVVE